MHGCSLWESWSPFRRKTWVQKSEVYSASWNNQNWAISPGKLEKSLLVAAEIEQKEEESKTQRASKKKNKNLKRINQEKDCEKRYLLALALYQGRSTVWATFDLLKFEKRADQFDSKSKKGWSLIPFRIIRRRKWSDTHIRYRRALMRVEGCWKLTLGELFKKCRTNFPM